MAGGGEGVGCAEGGGRDAAPGTGTPARPCAIQIRPRARRFRPGPEVTSRDERGPRAPRSLAKRGGVAGGWAWPGSVGVAPLRSPCPLRPCTLKPNDGGRAAKRLPGVWPGRAAAGPRCPHCNVPPSLPGPPHLTQPWREHATHRRRARQDAGTLGPTERQGRQRWCCLSLSSAGSLFARDTAWGVRGARGAPAAAAGRAGPAGMQLRGREAGTGEEGVGIWDPPDTTRGGPCGIPQAGGPCAPSPPATCPPPGPWVEEGVPGAPPAGAPPLS